MTDTILLMGHGSLDQDGATEFLRVVEAVRSAAPGFRVEAGFLEFAGTVLPTIDEAIDACAARGDGRVLAIPMLLFAAMHAREDMPAVVAAARTRHPGLDLRASPPLGPHRALLEIVEERVAALAATSGPAEAEDTAVLLVGRGASCSGANADLYKIGRLLWERNRYPLVECCFSGTTQPDVPTGIDRCVRLGAGRVLLAPYFINTGALVKRVRAQAAEARERHPGVRIAVAEHFGAHPKLVDVVLARARGLVEEGPQDPALGDRGWRYPRGHHHHPGDGADGHHGHSHDAPVAAEAP